MNLDREEKKKIIKEALKEWMDEKFIELGKWSLGAFLAALLTALIYFMLWTNGWTQLRDNNPPKHKENVYDEGINGVPSRGGNTR